MNRQTDPILWRYSMVPDIMSRPAVTAEAITFKGD
jgi:hypothetical protein